MKTSVIITVYNRPDILKACLQALEFGSSRVDEVVVSDDGSNEESIEKMKSCFPEFSFPIRYVWQEHKGFRAAAARNNAIRHSTGDYLVVLDCDIILLPDALDVHLSRARRGSFLAANRAFLDDAATRVALSGPLTEQIIADLWRQSDRSHLCRVTRQFERNSLLRKLKLARRHKPKLLSCHFSIFREDVYRINGFDERYVGWGFEDDDFCMRLHMAGIRGESIILKARAMHLAHEEVVSKPSKLSESRNMIRFKRPNVPAYCDHGLIDGSFKRQTDPLETEKRETGD